MELNHHPAAISTTIVAAVIHVTIQALRSAMTLPVSKTRLCVQGKRVWVFIGVLAGILCRSTSLPYPDESGVALFILSMDAVMRKGWILRDEIRLFVEFIDQVFGFI